MHTLSKSARRARPFAATLLALVAAGCGGDPAAVPAVPAAGIVTMNGKPLESGNIQLHPEKGRSAIGAIQDGKFTLTTYEAEDGAIVGKHKVVVVAYKEVRPKGSNEVEQRLITPAKYSDIGGTSLSVEIPPGGKTDLVISLD